MYELKTIKGIGPKSELLLNKLGIMDVYDLITYFPSRYDILKKSDLDNANIDDKVIVEGKVESVPLILRFNRGLNKMNFRLAMPERMIGVSIFNRAFMKQHLKIGTNIIVIGKYDKDKNILTASDIKFGYLGDNTKIEPVYHLTSGLTNKNLSTYINLALLTYGKEIPDYIPDYLQEKYHFINKKTSLNIVHNGADEKKLEVMLKRIKYEESSILSY